MQGIGDAKALRNFKRLTLQVVLTAMATTFLLNQRAMAQSWPIKEFEVVAVRPTGTDSYAEDLVRLFRNNFADIDAPTLEIFQKIPKTPARDKLLKDIEAVLEESAKIMEQSMFPPPALEPIVKRMDGSEVYRVYLVTDLKSAAGIYHHETCDDETLRRERVILLDYDDVQDGFDKLTPVGMEVVAHELFHAVQGGSSFHQNCGGSPIGGWIVEGMAKAVGWMVTSEIMGQEEFEAYLADPLSHRRRQAMAWGLRDYNRRLPVARRAESQPPIAYRTSSFWMYLAEYEATHFRPRTPGTNPFSMGYIGRLLASAPAERDCNYINNSCASEVQWLDAQLKVLFGSPLRDLYAKFIQAYALYGPGRLYAPPSSRYNEDWLGLAFFKMGESCEKIDLGPEEANLQVEGRINGFPAVSSLCFELKLERFEVESIPVVVTAEISTGVQSPDMNQITTAMADGTKRMERAKKKRTPDRGNQQATWEYDIDVLTEDDFGQGRLMVMTNVADIAGQTQPFSDENYAPIDLKFTAIHEYVELGASNVDPKKVADMIETGLPIKLDMYSAYVFPGQHNVVGENFIGTGYSAGVEKPCILRITANAAPQMGVRVPNLLVVYLQTSGPLKPGTYPVFFNDGFGVGKSREESLPPNEVAAGVNLSNMPEGRHDLNFEAGKLTIDAVDAQLLRGTITGVGVNRLPKGASAPGAPVEVRTVAARFSIRAKTPVGPYSDEPYACLSPR